MPEIADPPDPPCYSVFFESEIAESQSLAPDPLLSRARDGRGRFAKGSSGNPRGRPPGIANPKRRVPDLIARPPSEAALSALLDRKPHLLGLLAAQLLPPPPPDPAGRLGIALSAVRTAEDLQHVLRVVLAAVSRGDLAPTEAAHIARRGRARLRGLRRTARLQRRLRLTAGADSR